jgi:hypothetical protein
MYARQAPSPRKEGVGRKFCRPGYRKVPRRPGILKSGVHMDARDALIIRHGVILDPSKTTRHPYSTVLSKGSRADSDPTGGVQKSVTIRCIACCAYNTRTMGPVYTLRTTLAYALRVSREAERFSLRTGRGYSCACICVCTTEAHVCMQAKGCK